MKTLLSRKFILLLVILSLLFLKCGNDDNPTEVNYDDVIVGAWNVSKINWEEQNEKGSYDQIKLDSLGIIWNLVLRADKTAEQTTNYCCALSTYTGTWSANEFELTLNLKAPNSNNVVTTVYQFVIEKSKLLLNWSETGTIYYAEFTK